MPQRPPNIFETIGQMRGRGADLDRLLEVSRSSAHNGHYYHWDKLRYLKPPAGLSNEQWWAALKLARHGLLRSLPLNDAKGNPFQFGLPDPTQEHLHHIDQDAAGRIAMADRRMANPDMRNQYLVHSLVEEAITSSQLEGAAVTRPVAKQMIRSGRSPTDRGERMILNNYYAMLEIRKLQERPLTPEIILELHATLTDQAIENQDAVGRFRRPDERIAVTDTYGQVLHTPPLRTNSRHESNPCATSQMGRRRDSSFTR